MHEKNPRFVFTIGGVLSGVGKGVVTASLGHLLKARGLKVTAVKIDPYISIDAGTMRPAEHGEVFVTADGGEIDQDLGNYERFIGVNFTKSHNITTGKVYQSVIDKERSFQYGGRDASFIPDVINEVKQMILANHTDEDVMLVEIGGTTGDFENIAFLYAARELGLEYKSAYVMVTYLPFLKNVGELKTKPTQHAVIRLRETGISPDFIVTRNEIPVDLPRIESIAKRCFIPKENVIDNPDADSIYKVPLVLEKAGFASKILKKLDLEDVEGDLKPWETFVNNVVGAEKEIRIGLVGKYVTHGDTEHNDVYISVVEAVRHAAAHLEVKPKIIPISSEAIEKEGVQLLDNFKLDGMILPQGWGNRGTEGKISAANWAREKLVPYLGLCFGMQLACVAYARAKLGLHDANSSEVDPETTEPVIHLMPNQKEYLEKMQYGGTIRLGQWDCKILEDSVVEKAYLDASKKFDYDYFDSGNKPLVIKERHRHRYEFNNAYRERFEKEGLRISGTSIDGELVEMIELDSKVHPFYVGTQAHPEYQSRPLSPHPLFLAFLSSAASES